MPYDDSEPRSAKADARPSDAPAGKPEKPAPSNGQTSEQDAKAKADKKAEEQEAERARTRRKPFIIAGVMVLAVLAIVGGVIWWLSTKDLVSTDDAYTDGRAITVAPKVSGYVTSLNVGDNQRVRMGDVLVQVDQRDYLAARDSARGDLLAAEGQLDAAKAGLELARVTYPAKLAAAEAQQASAQATLTRAQSDYKRQTSVSPAATTRENVDQATAGQRQAAAGVAEASANVKQAQPIEQQIAQSAAQVKQLEGQVARARAQLETAELNLAYTTIRAPQDGWVTKRNVERGNYLSPGASIMSLVSPEVWVTANFKESQLARMRQGQHVDVAVDAYPDLKLKGHVDSFQLGSGAKFTAFSPENATGNYVKIVQRLPVKVVIDSGLDPSLPLPLGISVVPTVTVK